MAEIFQARYRIDTTRAPWWDYSRPGCYVVTICTKWRIPSFGSVANNQMLLNRAGQIVHDEWIKSVRLRPTMSLKLDAFQVMPDHFHGIIFLGFGSVAGETALDDLDEFFGVLGEQIEIAKKLEQDPAKQFGPQSKTLGSVINGFKASVTKLIGNFNPLFAWQPSFIDRIVRSKEELEKWRFYIKENPSNWSDKSNHRN